MKCKKHPEYKAIRKPKDCKECWKIYWKKHPEEKPKDISRGKHIKMYSYELSANIKDKIAKNLKKGSRL